MVDKTIDARGMFCPGPLLVLKSAANQLPSGTILKLLADDQASIFPISVWCQEIGNKLQSIEENDREIVYIIKLK